MATRRNFLGGLTALFATPLVPTSAAGMLAKSGAASSSSVAIAPATYKWAEVIVRAHDKCNLSMLERLLGLDKAGAQAVRAELLRNGIISAEVNRFGMHRAMKPLSNDAFIKSGKIQSDQFNRLKNIRQSSTKEISKAVDDPVVDEETSHALNEPTSSSLKDIKCETHTKNQRSSPEQALASEKPPHDTSPGKV